MRIINTNLKQEWLITLETWQIILNDLLWEWLHHSSIRKEEEILSESIKKLQRKKRDKMSNLKHWKSKNISSSEQIFREIWWQVKVLEDRIRKEKRNERKSESYIILIRAKNHLQFRISSMMTCINERLRKASWIRKVKEKISSKIIIECIRNTDKSKLLETEQKKK